MKAFYFLTLLVVFFSYPVALSQPAASKGNAYPAPRPSTETPTYRDLLELQEKNHEHELDVQKEIADKAIQAMSQQTQTILVIVQIGVFLVVLFSAALGWWIKQQVDHFGSLSKQSEDILSVITAKLSEIESAHTNFNSRIEAMSQLATPIESKVQKFSLEVEKFQESIEDIKLKTELAGIGVRLRSDKSGDRLRAAQAASEIAQNKRGAIAIPLLLECLRAAETDVAVIAEALYGLAYRAKELIGDEEAIKLILDASQSPEKNVRRQALEIIAKIGLNNPDFRQRLKSCYESDDDDELKAFAGQILRESDLV